jgi:hypothetical protein
MAQSKSFGTCHFAEKGFLAELTLSEPMRSFNPEFKDLSEDWQI